MRLEIAGCERAQRLLQRFPYMPPRLVDNQEFIELRRCPFSQSHAKNADEMEINNKLG